MSVITSTDLNAVLDAIGLYTKRLYGDGATYGMGDPAVAWGSAGAVDTLKTAILAMTDLDPVAAIIDQAVALEPATDAYLVAAGLTGPIIAALSSHVSSYGLASVLNLEQYLKYLNVGAGGTWNALQAPFWRDLFYRFSGGTYPEEYNVYFEVLQGATYTNALMKFVVTGAGAGTPTDGVAVDSTKYCGGFAKANVSGLAGSGTLTVTGTAYDPVTMAISTSKTWTANITGNGVTALVVGSAPANSLIVDVTGVSIAAGITAGTIYIEAHRPTGRTLIP